LPEAITDFGAQSTAVDRTPRLAVVDVARGVALIGMAVYHLSWDLAYFALVPIGFPFSLPMRMLSHAVAASFLALVGVSLALAHRQTFHRRAFQRRLLVICGAALLVTAASVALAPQDAITFGILHCIVVASLLAAPLIQAPIAAPIAATAVAFVAPALVASPWFDVPSVAWLGLGLKFPDTFDWRPLAPWSGFVFLGLAAARLAWRRLEPTGIARWRPRSIASRAAAWAGRRSLPIYLIHQPVLFALLFAATGFSSPDARRDEASFRDVCQSQCAAGGGGTDPCRRSCDCLANRLKQANLAIAFSHADLDPAQHAKFSTIIQACAREP
jgi:uncharacterized membrane protein